MENDKIEIWKDIEGYEGIYQVSTLGRVRSIDRVTKVGNIYKNYKGRVLTPSKNPAGYKTVSLIKEGHKKTHTIHTLVAKAFIPNPENKEEVDHINTIKEDNTIYNLRWTTRLENINNPLSLKHNIEGHKQYAHPIKGVSNIDGSEIYFRSKWEAGLNGFSRSAINKCIKGTISHYKNYIWTEI